MNTQYATRYNPRMNKKEFIEGFKSVHEMIAYYIKNFRYETSGSKLALEYYEEYYDANHELCEEIEDNL